MEELLQIAKTLFHIDLANMEKVLDTISKASLSEDLKKKEAGIQLTKLHEEYIKAKHKVEEQTHHESFPKAA